MVDSLWFVLTLVLLAVVSVVLVLVLILRREETCPARETRTEYLHPDYGQTAGFRVASAPSSEVARPETPLIAPKKAKLLGVTPAVAPIWSVVTPLNPVRSMPDVSPGRPVFWNSAKSA